MRRIGVVTVARSDYGIYRPILRQLVAHPQVDLQLLVGGGHLVPQYGLTVRAIEDEFPIAARVDMLLGSGSRESIALAMGVGAIGFAQAYARLRPDLLLTLGDRFEMLSAVVASVPQQIPVAHIHGGELTEGAIDDAIRHAITKLSHLHFAATEDYARRILQMGEEPWRVVVSGAPALDEVASVPYLSRSAVCDRFGFDPADPFLLVTFHPVTLGADAAVDGLDALLAALERATMPCVMTFPNADAGSQSIIAEFTEYAGRHRAVRLEPNLGTDWYFNTLRHAAAMVGNSSSGIIEAASFAVPVVNIGDRQKGRVRSINVVDVPPDADAILAAIRRVVSPTFKESLAGMVNPYGDGRAAHRIVDRLVSVPTGHALLQKRFVDLRVNTPETESVSA